MVASRQWRVPSDKERKLLGVGGIETKMRWCTRVQGRFTELSHAEPRCWYAPQVRRQTAHPSRPARWNSSPEVDGSWRVAGHTLDLGLHFQLEKFSISTEC